MMANKYQNIPQELKDLDRWVCSSNTSKVPMRGWEFEPASCSNPETWTFYEQCEAAVEEGYYDHIGFVFAEDGYVGIDIDDGYDESGIVSDLACDIIGKFESYTERSKSGRGFHIIVKGDIPFEGKNNRAGVEIYKTKRFFIMTGRVVAYRDIIENQDALDWLLNAYFSNVSYQSEFLTSDRIYSPDWLPEWTNEGCIRIEPFYPNVESGSRNISMTSLAGYLKNVGYDRDDIYWKLEEVNAKHCFPPLPKRELSTIVSSVMRYND